VSVAVPSLVRSSGPELDAPLVVAGTVRNRPMEALVCGLADVLERIAAWTEQDPDAIGCWGLRRDYSTPLTIPVRCRPGRTREGRRIAHLLRLLPGEPHGGALTALCGERLSLLDIETLRVGAGMPCELCLARCLVPDAPVSSSASDPRADAVEGGAVNGRALPRTACR
jgi:hypothetical protein